MENCKHEELLEKGWIGNENYICANCEKEISDTDIHNNHDHTSSGECLVIEWKGAVEYRDGYEKKEALTQQQIDARQEEIRLINKQNRANVAASNKAPF